MTPDELRTKVAEAQHSVWMRDGVAWANETAEYRLIFTEMAEAVLPVILDAAKTAINEAVDERGFTESTDYDHFTAIDVVAVTDAIDSLRTKP